MLACSSGLISERDWHEKLAHFFLSVGCSECRETAGRPPYHRETNASAVAVAVGQGDNRAHPESGSLRSQPGAAEGARIDSQTRAPAHQGLSGAPSRRFLIKIAKFERETENRTRT